MRAVVVLCVMAGCAKSEVGADAGLADATAAVAVDAVVADAASVADARPPAVDAAACASETVDDCCGAVCEGIGTTNGEPACEARACVFRCAGESYDVNGLADDGCEVVDDPVGNHTSGGAIDLGSKPCGDGDSQIDLAGVMPSHRRQHVPQFVGFSPTTGAAPDQHIVEGSGGFCVNDVDLTLAVAGSSNPSCYELVVTTDVSLYSCNGNCRINPGSGSYGSGTTIVITVRKICDVDALTERATYTVAGHL